MTQWQIARYNVLVKRKEQFVNFINLLDATVELARKTKVEIDNEIAKL